MPEPAADAAREAVAAALTAAARTGDTAFTTSAHTASVRGMALALTVSTAKAAIAAVLTLVFPPGRPPRTGTSTTAASRTRPTACNGLTPGSRCDALNCC